MIGLDVSKVKVDVIGGHAGTTIIPLLSQVFVAYATTAIAPPAAQAALM